MISDCHNIRCKHIHDFNCRQTLKLAVDQRAAEHITGNGIDNVFLLTADLIDIAGQARNTTDKFIVYLLCKKVPMKVI